VAIIKGIPIQRADISLRDFDAKASAYMYMLVNGRISNPRVTIQTVLHINWNDKWCDISPRIIRG